MRTISYKKTLANASLSEETAMDLKVQQQYGSAFKMFTDSTNVRIKLKYVFTDSDGNEQAFDLTTQDLAQNVGTVVSFPWKAGHIRATVQSHTGAMSGGTLRIDASVSAD